MSATCPDCAVERVNADAMAATNKLQSFEGIVAKGYDWRTLGCSAEELAWNAAQQAEASAAE